MKEKVYLRFIDGEYYGNSFEWDTLAEDQAFDDPWMFSPIDNTKDARLYTIRVAREYLDDLSEFIRPSVILDFIKTIEDPNTGEELYNKLQVNVKYVLDLVKTIITKAEPEKASQFRDAVFGRHEPYGSENECHLCLFGDVNSFMLWVKPHEEFVKIFKQRLRYNQYLYLLAYDDDSLRDSQIKALETRLANLKKERERVDASIEQTEKTLAELKQK